MNHLLLFVSILCLSCALVVFAFYYPNYPLSHSSFLAFFQLPGSFQWQTFSTNLISILVNVFDLLILLVIAY
ncbi:MAG: hypothetical protein QME64_12600, partial [bacterium]|nr:hypothetical protein [bacterium]